MKPHASDSNKEYIFFNPKPWILKIVMAAGLTTEEFYSESKTTRVVGVRVHVIKELRKKGYSMAEIGRIISRDHSTVLHALKKP